MSGIAVRAHPAPLRIGTRASPLALWQARHFLGVVGGFCPMLRGDTFFEECALSTTGDRILDRRLAEIGGKGLFAKEIHEALLDRRIDFAVHSLKDLETELPAGIVLACTLRREDPRDAIVLAPGGRTGRPGAPFATLPAGAVVGTSSVRRQSQLLHARPDLRVETIRGNVQTRLRRLAEEGFDATMLAFAGLKRLGMDEVASVVLDPEEMVPAAGQGIVGVTVRADDTALLDLLAAVEDPAARAVATAERALLTALDGSCRTPIGCHARILMDGALYLTGLIARPDGSFLLRRRVSGPVADAGRIGRELGAALRRDAPADILA
jgi:hydroxymethylbilane synthase